MRCAREIARDASASENRKEGGSNGRHGLDSIIRGAETRWV